MPELLNRRNALLGWLVWKLAKRRLRRSLGRTSAGATRAGRIVRTATAVAALALVGAAWVRRSRSSAGGSPP